MNIIALYLDRPGYCMEPVVSFLRRQGHSVRQVPLQLGRLGARIQQLGTPLVLDLSQWGSNEARLFDLAITTEPLCALGLRLRRIAKRQIFWRIDYRPRRHLGSSYLLNWLATGIDEVWSIVPGSAYRHVPFMLDPKEIAQGSQQVGREDRVLWTGPDYSSSGRKSLVAVADLDGVSVVVTDWRSPDARWTEDQLGSLLLHSKVGLALYGAGEKRYSDPARVKRFLAAGLAVVTDDSYPFARELEEAGAGTCLKRSAPPEAVRQAVEYCLRDSVWPVMSHNALNLARQYITSSEWLWL